MMFTASMRLLAAVALETDSEAIATELLRLGALETVSVSELAGDWPSRLSSVEPKVNLARLGELRQRVEGFMAMANPPIARPVLGPDGVGAGPTGIGAGPDGIGAGPAGIGAGPAGIGAGPDGIGAGPDGVGAGPAGGPDKASLRAGGASTRVGGAGPVTVEGLTAAGNSGPPVVAGPPAVAGQLAVAGPLATAGQLAVAGPLATAGVSASLDLDTVEKQLAGIAAAVNTLRERQKALQDEILKLEEMSRQVAAFQDLKAVAAAATSYSFLSIKAGLLPTGRLSELSSAMEGLPVVLLPAGTDGSNLDMGAAVGVTAGVTAGVAAGVAARTAAGVASSVVLLSLKKDAPRIDSILVRLGWEDARLPDAASKDAALRELADRIAGLRERQAACTRELQVYFTERKNQLTGLWAELRVQELVARVRASFSRTAHTVLFTGWIPADRLAAVEAGIRRAALGGCSIEWISPGQGEAATLHAPVAMRNPAPLQPFEGLVRNYGIPEYGSVDPTPFVTVAYLVMFGLMFGDAGHGLVVTVIGLLGRRMARAAGKPDGLYRVIAWCGAAAIVSGMLFGSYFGMAWLPPLWFDYHGVVNGHEGTGSVRTVYDILGIAIRFGMIVLGTGFVINWINLVRKRDWLTLLLDKAGLLGGWIYGAGAWVAFYFVAHDYRGLPPGSVLLPLLGIPTIAIALKSPIHFLVEHDYGRFKPGMILDFVMEWIVEVLEIYSGYLANTLSFMRVAGLGIAHVSLMTAFFQIARMITPTGPLSLPAIAVLVLGNALVIALEGLSAGIQSLRLNYYEFFSKYFNGTGKAYRPISLNGAD